MDKERVYYCGWYGDHPVLSNVKNDEDCVQGPVPAVELFVHEVDAAVRGFRHIKKVKIVEV